MKLTVFFIGLLLQLTNVCRAQTDSVVVLPMKMKAPDGAKKIGSMTLGNNATATNCDYEALINDAKIKAKAMSGNIVKITELIAPAFISKCYKIKADVYYSVNLSQYQVQKTDVAVLPKEYATVYIYRLKDTLALVGGYFVHMDGDSVICKVKSRSRDSVNIYKNGPVKFWADIEKRAELKLDVQIGHSYYIRCGVRKGEIRMVPVLEAVTDKIGKAEYDEDGQHKKNMSVQYLQQVH